MDEILAQRYLALLLAYDAGGRGDLALLKRSILEQTPTFLRADAALMLLSLYDQMILRPYTGPIATLSGEWMAVPRIGLDINSFFDRVRRSLDEIFKQLSVAQERPISSHQVLLAIERAWPTISELYGWA